MTLVQDGLRPEDAWQQKNPGANAPQYDAGTRTPWACPLLGLADDRATHAFFATPEHRCFAGEVSKPAARRQVQFCISDRYGECPAFAKHQQLRLKGQQPSRRFGRLRTAAGSSLGLVLPGLLVIAALVATAWLTVPVLAR